MCAHEELTFHPAGEDIATRRELVLLMAVSALLLIAWSLAVPIFEAPDEQHHWQYARYLHDYRGLPEYGPDLVEANSPPLYYLLIAPLAINSELPAPLTNNPPGGQVPGSSPRFQHTVGDLSRYISIRVARLISALLSLGAVFFCYLAGVEATGASTTGLLAAGLMGLLPQFCFRGMNVSNDALVTLMGAAATYLFIRLLRRGSTWLQVSVTAVVVALAFLSKATSFYLAAPFALTMVLDRSPRSMRVRRLGVLGLTLLVALPWLLRNQLLYGDPLASQAMLAAVSGLVDQKSLSSPYFFTVFPIQLVRSFIGYFGWMSVPLPNAIYALFVLLPAAATVGLLLPRVRDSIDWRILAVLASIPLLNLVVVVYINLTFTQPQGRYLFPALCSMAVLGAIGLEGLPWWTGRARRLLSTMLVLLNIGIITFLIIPTYAGAY